MAKPTPAPQPPPSDDLFGGVHDFFASGTWIYIRNAGLFVLAVLWAGSVLWVLKDARRRIADPVLVAVAAVVGAVPVLGPLVYLLLRPPEYLEDVEERRLEIDALEAQLAAAELACPSCSGPVRADFLVCPLCATRLKQACANCGSPLEALWQACPACAAPRRTEEPAAAPRAALDQYLLGVARDETAPEPGSEPAAEPAPAPGTV